MAKNEYRTRQRSDILLCLENNSQKHLTADEITELLRNNGSTVGKTTVYRALDKLVSEGVVRKYDYGSGKSACYQFISESEACIEHFHLKCTVCGKLFHVECDFLNGISEHVFEHHRFSVDNTKTVLYGICEECKG